MTTAFSASACMEHPISAYIRCVGRRVVKTGPFKMIRAVHILLDDYSRPDVNSLRMTPGEVLDAVSDLTLTLMGTLKHVVILGASSPRAQQEALLLAKYIQSSSAAIEYTWVAPPADQGGL